MENHFNLSVMPEVLNRASSLGFLSLLVSRLKTAGITDKTILHGIIFLVPKLSDFLLTVIPACPESFFVLKRIPNALRLRE
jgi:hypothetical protein